LKLAPSNSLLMTAMSTQINGNAPQPFDEMKLNNTELDNKIEKLKRKGYFTIPISDATHAYLKNQDKPEASWKLSHIGKKLPLNNGYGDTARCMAAQIVSRIAQRNVTLRPNEFEIRHPGEHGAVQWHQDRAPRVLACIATLEGRGTEFISPLLEKEKFTKSSNTLSKALELKAGSDLLGNAIEVAKKDRFYFFAACGMASEHVPKLVHRAPPPALNEKADRSIFIARWSTDERGRTPT
jgi:hypothetical protein